MPNRHDKQADVPNPSRKHRTKPPLQWKALPQQRRLYFTYFVGGGAHFLPELVTSSNIRVTEAFGARVASETITSAASAAIKAGSSS